MKAAILKEFGASLVIEEVGDPCPGANEAVITVMACGIDGTDLKLLDGFGYTPTLPFVMGHEPAGVVESVGSGVTDFAPGDRVVPYIFLIPVRDPWYRTEREQLCPDMLGILGVKGWGGGYAERLLVPACQLVRIPDAVSWHDAAVHCDAGLTAYHAVRRSRLKLGETVLVMGVGGVGSFVVQFARLSGARVIAVERSQPKLQWARRLGAAEAILGDDVRRAVRDLTGGRGVDCVLDVVGSKESIQAALEVICAGGRIVVVGYTNDAFVLTGKQLAQNELELIGSRAGSRKDLDAALGLTAAGFIQSIVTEIVPLERVNEALARLRDGEIVGRLVLDVRRKGTARN